MLFKTFDLVFDLHYSSCQYMLQLMYLVLFIISHEKFTLDKLVDSCCHALSVASFQQLPQSRCRFVQVCRCHQGTCERGMTY